MGKRDAFITSLCPRSRHRRTTLQTTQWVMCEESSACIHGGMRWGSWYHFGVFGLGITIPSLQILSLAGSGSLHTQQSWQWATPIFSSSCWNVRRRDVFNNVLVDMIEKSPLRVAMDEGHRFVFDAAAASYGTRSVAEHVGG